MEFLYRVTPTRIGMVTETPTPEEEAIVEQHFNYIKSLTEKGIVLVFGRTQNSGAQTFGIIIFRAESKEAAHSIMNNDPAVRQGIMQAELYPYKVVGLNARGWQVE